MDSIFQFLGSAGFPTSFVGVVLFLYFTLRKQEAVVRADQIAHIERLKIDIKELSEDKEKLSDLVDELRKRDGENVQLIAKLQAQIISLGQNIITKD